MTLSIPEKGMLREEMVQTLSPYKGDDLDGYSGWVVK